MFSRDVPLYLITGFLESGKTRFTDTTLHQPYFRTNGQTLVIVCEEGEEEYDMKGLRQMRTSFEFIHDPEELTEEKLRNFDKKYKPERVLIEFNPLWSVSKLLRMKLPKYWDWAQHIVIIDSSTFQVYSQNMMPLITEMITGRAMGKDADNSVQVPGADMVVFNRAKEEYPLANFRRSVKVLTGMAQIMFEGLDGEPIEVFKDQMPYDMDAPVIELDDIDFGIWYVDMMDNLDKYIGKKIHLKGQVLKSRKLDADYFVPGRKAMTCCADDVQFIGYVCKSDKAPSLKEGDWVDVTAVIKKEYSPAYREEGAVLYAETLTSAEAPKDELVYFT